MYVTVRNDLAANSQSSWVFCGDLAYGYENLRGHDPKDPEYIPIGLATGSQFNVIMTAEEMVKSVGGDVHRVIPPHEERLKDLYPVAHHQEWAAHYRTGARRRREKPGPLSPSRF